MWTLWNRKCKKGKIKLFFGFLIIFTFFIAAFDFFIAGERGLALNNNVDFIEVVPLGLSVLFILIANFFFNLFINTNKVLLDTSINNIPFVERKGMQRNQFIFSGRIFKFFFRPDIYFFYPARKIIVFRPDIFIFFSGRTFLFRKVLYFDLGTLINHILTI